MFVRLVTSIEYFTAFPNPKAVYSSRKFIETNSHRAEAVRYFVGFDENAHPRLGVVLGLRDGQWLCPFSAPFGEIAYNHLQSLERIYDFISELCDLLSGTPVKITLGMNWDTQSEMTARLTGTLANYAAKTYYDYNYHYDLNRTKNFEAYLDRAARKNYRKALQSDFVFEMTADIERVYSVIKANRESHGYPLAMSLEQVMATVSVTDEPSNKPVHASLFVLSHKGIDVAAALVYDIAPSTAQVVYWGDAPGFSELRPMNLLPIRIFQHYHEKGYSILDIGPSSSKGIPSPGLCRFKESLGCSLTLKPTFMLQ